MASGRAHSRFSFNVRIDFSARPFPSGSLTIAGKMRSRREVGLAILRNEADVGLGIQSVADALELRFLPITTEGYDVVLHAENTSIPAVQVF